MVEVNKENIPKWKTLNNNKILKSLSDEDFIKISNYYKEGFPIFYMLKDNYKLERQDITKFDCGEYFIVVNPLTRTDIYDGKINSIEKLSEHNFKFLSHMFRYNKTLKEFSCILDKGHFDVTNQYNNNDIWNYFKNNVNFYTEKKGKYIGSMETKSKLDYFPTNFTIQYMTIKRILFNNMKNRDLIRKSTLKFIDKYCGQNIYDDLVSMGRFDLIDECFNFNLNRSKYSYTQADDTDKNKVVIADLFAGEGEWLNLFKKMLPNKKTYFVANEIEQNRFLECKSKKFNNVIWGAYEELEDKIPKKFIDLLLFNPPYGETDGERNVHRFFRMLIEDKYLSRNAVVIFVLNQNDLESMLPSIARYFNVVVVEKHDNGNEQDRLKQYVVIGNYLDYEETDYYVKKNLEVIRNYLDNNRNYYYSETPFAYWINSKNINECFDRFNISKNPNLYKSNLNSENWLDLMRNTRIETFQGKRIKLAEKPRNIGTAANLIVSGLINGEIEGKHEHCVAAGITEKTIKTLDEETGNIVVTKQSAPFLSVLSGGNIIEITEQNQESNINIEEDGTVVVS